MMIREQDRTMDSIAGTLSTLAQQAGLMGQELEEHHESVSSLSILLSSPIVGRTPLSPGYSLPSLC